jgi:Protein of unknown function (DUF3631)
MLLADIHQVLDGTWPPPPDDEPPSPVERMFSRDLVKSLCEMQDRPWPEAQRGKAISERWLARNLGRFGIRPKTLRIGDDRAKGYERAVFVDVFDRYLSGPGQFIRDSVTCEEKDGLAAVTDGLVVTDGKTPPTEEMSRCHAQDTLHHDAHHSPDSNSKPIEEEALLL